MTEQEIIAGCQAAKQTAQKAFYERYAPRMLGVCKRYIRTHEDAEDIMIEGLFKAIDKIGTYKYQGSFEGWVRRIVVNEALMFLRKQHNFNTLPEVAGYEIEDTEISIAQELEGRDILALLDKLPTGYRTVFNLYVIEGYKHREIGEILNISLNTSKSQLILAKEKLKNLLLEYDVIKKNA